MKEMGELRFFLGLEIKRDISSQYMEISQAEYLQKVLNKFGMSDSKPVSTPIETKCDFDKNEFLTEHPYRELIGSLLYLSIVSRPDICVAVNYFGKFQSCPNDKHWIGLKRVLRYLNGTKNARLIFKKHYKSKPLVGYADADFANDNEERKSVSGYLFKVFGNTISWCTKRQPTVSLSSTEAELISLCNAAKEGIWIARLLDELKIPTKPFIIYEDNIPCIRIAEEPREHQRTKHIDIQYMYIRELIKNKEIQLQYLATDKQIADALTKGLPRIKFNEHFKNIGMQN